MSPKCPPRAYFHTSVAREINERTRSKIALLVYILLRARTFGEGPGARARRMVSVKWLAEQIGCATRSVERVGTVR